MNRSTILFSVLSALLLYTLFPANAQKAIRQAGLPPKWQVVTTENTSSALPSDKAYAMLFDADSTLWVATDLGLAYQKNGKWSTLPAENKLAGKSCLNLFLDSKGSIWVSTEEQGLAMRDTGGQWIYYSIENGLSDNLVQDIDEDKFGGYWVANGAAVSYLKDGKLTEYKPSANPFANMFTVATDPANGEAWAGADCGLFRFREGQWSEVAEGAAFGSVQDILIHEGRVWLATQNGLQHFDGSKWTSYTTENGLPDNYLTTLSLDNSGTLWVGTDGFGVVMRKGDGWQTTGTADGLSADDIRCIAFTADNRPYIGTHLGGISYLGKDNSWHSISSSGLIGNTVKDIFFAKEAVWYGTSAGISRYTVSSGHWQSYTQKNGDLPGNNTRRIVRDRSGGFWFALYDGGVAYFKADEGLWKAFTPGEGSISNGRVTDIAEAPDGRIWATTYGGGAAVYNGKEWKTYSVADGLPTNSLFSITVAPDGALWFGTVAGVAVMRGEKFTLLTEGQNGLADNNVRNVCFSPAGEAYICTNKGLSICRKDGSIETFNAGNGFISDFVNHAAFDEAGNAWLSCWTAGLYLQVKGGGFYPIGQECGFPAEEANVCRPASDGSLYIGTDRGAAILENPSVLISVVTASGQITSTGIRPPYPNPARDNVFIGREAREVRLYSTSGNLLLSDKHTDRLALSGLSPGVYILIADGEVYRISVL